MEKPEFFVGKRIREYEILAIQNQARMGTVYRGRHVLLEQERAIWIVQTGFTGTSDLADRFIREARGLARMRHPNLVEVYEFGKLDEGAFFLIQELLHGENVRRRMDTLEKIPVLDAVRIVREAALGLHMAHSTGILHRDVCPDNLFLVKRSTGEEVTKVIDFAIARPTAQEARTMQSTPILLGRPEFWSPEQFGAGSEEITLDARADIYSLGVTLYYMVSGRLPFVSLVPKGTPEPFTAKEAPPKLESLIRKALSLNRDDRHSSMLDFIQDLDEVTHQEGQTTVQVSKQHVSMKFQPGYVFAGRYEIQKKIGKGGMGTVFKALDKFLEIPVALKTINPDISTDEKVLARLKREVILARKVAHPNVCRLYDIGESDGTHYVSMEYVDGMTLSDMLLVRGKLPFEEGLKLLYQILQALQEAHRAGIIHRDLKPQNIMIDVEQRAHIMDFGISFSAEVGRLTTTGMMIGTPRYMAPEQFGQHLADLRADIYSMGIIFYETFTGRVPFDAKTPATVMYAHLNETPTPPTQLVPSLPPALEQIILKALEKDPDNRYRKTGDLLAAIDSLLAGQAHKEDIPVEIAATSSAVRPPPSVPRQIPQPPTVSPPPASSSPPTAQHSPPESRSLVAPLALALVVLIAAGFGAWYYWTSQPEPVASTNRSEQKQPSTTGESGGTDKPEMKEVPRQEPPDVKQPEPEQKTEAAQQDQNDPPAPAQEAPQSPPESTPTEPTPIPAEPIPSGPGTVRYEGKYPVSVFEGRKLVLDTATAPSAELPAGSYKLTLVSTNNALIRQNVTVEVKQGETVTIPAPPMSRFTLNATPSNCKIFLDTTFVDVAPIFDFPIQAGNHHLRVHWEKLEKEKTAFFTVEPDRTITLRAIADETTLDIFEEK